MARHTPRAALATMVVAVHRAAASGATFCPSAANNICYDVRIPETSAESGSGDIYFRITAPTSYQWVALGTGSAMSRSNIFVIYQDSHGNLTLSPRHGTFHTMPTQDTSSNAARLTLLAGSGVADDVMTANVMCANCESWSDGGSLSLTSTGAPWIGAWKSGKALDTDNENAALNQHDDTTQFQLDMTKAVIASDSNPFLDSSSSGDESGSSGSGSGDSGSSSGSDSTSGSSTASSSVPGIPSATILTAHGVIMAIVMVALYPVGSALMPLAGRWWLHGLWQGVAFLLMWAGFALGIVSARQRGLGFPLPNDAGIPTIARVHTILGTTIVSAFGLQPLFGLIHHHHYVRHQARGAVSHIHIWWGRLLMVLGIINGGLGLHFAGASHGVVVGYAVVAAVLFCIYIASKFLCARIHTNRRRPSGGASKSLNASRSAEGPVLSEPLADAENRRRRLREERRFA